MKTPIQIGNINDDKNYSIDYEGIINNLKSTGNYFLVEGDGISELLDNFLKFHLNSYEGESFDKTKLKIEYFSVLNKHSQPNDDNLGIIFYDGLPIGLISSFRDELNYTYVQYFENLDPSPEYILDESLLKLNLNTYFDNLCEKFAKKNFIQANFKSLYFEVNEKNLGTNDFNIQPTDYSIYTLNFVDLCLVGIVLVKKDKNIFKVNKFEI